MATGYTPIYRVMKGGIDITGNFNDRTTQIKVELIAGGGEGDNCTITLDDRDWALAAVDPGDQIGVYLGYKEVGLAYLGTFNLTDVVYKGKPRSVQLTGTSTKFGDLNKAPTSKEYIGKTVGEILSDIAGETGMAVAGATGLTDQQVETKNQITSNLHVINELERRYGAVAKVVDGKLLFVPRDSLTSASGEPVPTLVLKPEHFGDWQVRYMQRSAFSGVKAFWWDEHDKVRKWVQSSTAPIGQATGGEYPMGEWFKSAAEATAAANSKMEAFNRAQVEATFDLAKGDPWIRDTQTISVQGMRDRVNGSYVVQRAIHTYIKSTGIRSTLECRGPGNGTDFSDRADDLLLSPLPGEVMGTVLPEKWNFPDDL
ncbi:phage protein D [Bradyrhizobium elkanii]|uniref:phage late control D family protein n=1 Tax=Bradyrhizobium elkanii TaxID=29448 RepID=UPI002166E96A|nr:contractile injection system protein, VgrG/Pvc8 family [Bradyrhizobium elkanii]MCS3449838.1 phage protein D [Bradyrhizobium elkanii]MCS3559019.1 phage protein D [Bradyrhizobium elkanii]MCW2151135.1 phage protein D [Bradyrhizobium elkanii]MCW2374866.1 phage protein D [Bradyrhizobium elkanii]